MRRLRDKSRVKGCIRSCSIPLPTYSLSCKPREAERYFSTRAYISHSGRARSHAHTQGGLCAEAGAVRSVQTAPVINRKELGGDSSVWETPVLTHTTDRHFTRLHNKNNLSYQDNKLKGLPGHDNKIKGLSCHNTTKSKVCHVRITNSKVCHLTTKSKEVCHVTTKSTSLPCDNKNECHTSRYDC